MPCAVCGHDNPPAAKFCAQCSAPLSASLVCTHCGTSNSPGSKFCTECAHPLTHEPGDRGQGPGVEGQGSGVEVPSLSISHPTAFANGRYQVQKFLGQGGKKRVYLAHDTRLDRDVAFALLGPDSLDAEGRTRIRREAQAMARLGDHPHVVTVYDIGDEEGHPYLVSQYMAGGDLEEAIRAAEGHRLPLEQVLAVADQVCQALEHAHKQGIVHRDVKPGNVWLTGGVGVGVSSKLGDFGLALSADRSRMTQAGMVVGTAHYMAPEQALGSDVTPRSDLYALGAMLYELVTGRPPFVGDEPVAIITQHLHTAPVLPSWHRQGLPAALETLILRLLEKDPSNRPASATEVRAALASIAAPTPTPPPNLGEGQGERADVAPLYRRLFIGREPELRRLEAGFDGALSGAGSLVMVVGEPGIGKTAVCEQLATYAALRGGRALVGHCYEEGSLSLPYLPFAEALRSYVLERPPEALKEELGTGAAEVARIVSEIRDRVQIELRPPGDPEDDRYRLFQAVTGFLQHASRVQAIVLVLEDLHWADRGTLDLLVHIARQLKGTRLLIVGTYRDVEVDRAHPLSATLAELRRVQDLERVPLRGLTPDEVHRLISGLTGQEVRWSLAEAVHRQTEGNPLFVQEVFRYLAEEGVIRREDGRWRRAGEEPPEMSIPEGLRDVIGKRLSRLSAECNALLSVAAVIGREFALDTLRAVSGIPEEALLLSLEEALRVGVLEERARPGQVQYRFGHALFRQTLYEELIAPRRIRLHQQVARAMEQQYGARLEEHAAELAEHYAHSSDAADLAKAVEYGQMAARRASAVYAHGEAVRHLEQAMQVQEVLAPEDKAQRCDLLLALAQALMPLGELPRVLDPVAPEALALAEELGDQERAARACRIAIEALERSAPFAAWRSPEGRRWADLADSYAAPGTATRVFTDIALADVRDRENRPDEANALRRRALDLARQLDDQGARLFAVAKANQGGNLSWQDQLALVEEAESWPRDRASARDVGLFLYRSGLVHLWWGERGRAEELWAEMEALASRTRDGNVLLRPFFVAAILALLDGRLEEALEIGEQIVAKGEEFGGTQRALGFAHNLTLQPRFHLGQPEDWGPSWGALLLAHLGRRAEAQELLRESVASGSVAGQGSLSSPALLEAAVLLEDADAARTLSEEAAPVASMLTPSGTGQNLACVARHLGAAAALLGDRAAARRYYEQGLELCEKVRFRPEIALIRLGLAELALSDQVTAISSEETKLTADELKAEGLEHLEFALAEFQAMKMRPSFERALRLQGQLAT